MNAKQKRLFAAFSAVLSCLSLLTGCADSINPPQDSAAQETTAAVTAAPEESVEPAEQTAITDPFQYTAGTPEVSGEREDIKNVTFFRDGIKICGKLCLPDGEGPFPTVVLCSGQTALYSYYTDEAEKFAQNGYAALIFDFIGSGARSSSGGEMTEYSMLTEAKDLNVILDSLSQLPKVDSSNVFLWGHSLGGLVATYIGCRRPDDIQGMMLVEPSYRYPDEVREVVAAEANGDFAQIPDTVPLTDMNTVVGKIFFTDMYGVDIYDKMPDCGKDVLIFLGTEPGCLGANYHSYFERAQQTFPSAEIAEISGADHFFQGTHGEQMMEQCLAFLKAHQTDADNVSA